MRFAQHCWCCIVATVLVSSVALAQPKKSTPNITTPAPTPIDTLLLPTLLRSEPHHFQHILDSADKYRVQILYTQINRAKNGKPLFTSYAYRLNDKAYFYPASTVKFPAAVLTLEKLNVLSYYLNKPVTKDLYIRIDSHQVWQTPVLRDVTAKDSLASLEHFIKKVFLVSDNDGYNRLYEFLGQDYLNQRFRFKGFKNTKITQRLSYPATPEQNKVTNTLFLYGKDGTIVYYQPSTTATGRYDDVLAGVSDVKQGKGYYQNDSLVLQPKDFTPSNFFPLTEQQELLKRIMFPDSYPIEQQFGLQPADYEFLWRYMGMLPRESDYPRYDTTEYWDSYVKFFMFGDSKKRIPPHIRIFNKVGDAYGYVLDNAYIVDFERGVEFLLSAVIYCNNDEIFNDNTYELDEIGFPFMARLGNLIYNYECQRKRAVKPDLRRYQVLFEPQVPKQRPSKKTR
jgi:hypothetical protein